MEEIQNNDELKKEEGEAELLAKCQKERDEYLDGWKRAKADLINYKKEEAKRFDSFAKFSQEALIRGIIPVLDSFDLALATLEKDGKAEKGIYLIKAQLEDILKQYGLEKVNILIGEPYNPALAEAIVSVESDKPSGIIIEEIERGYMLNGKLIRPARVKISK
ncbi:nucleotide exchange factor GrpE [Candidatus Wolfebacteria bacterium RIFCSPLOWO2_01_FULL_38_11]|uniref:Protein GrpE n=2 Tax=Candidatus Wolfeibacteriota TaxID=1752735 RepID=A0A0G0FRI5_9BACT|nr:MAG: Protein GrpE [Candidatus Wolfebacteria bacterium GW2011_GWC1_37_10]OGM90847.1 MAG: nucleotide exchange factor GrpE [Candidatus Wolfebacteria bacterium RIFCSPLOWO2_01_FULL_38_11]